MVRFYMLTGFIILFSILIQYCSLLKDDYYSIVYVLHVSGLLLVLKFIDQTTIPRVECVAWQNLSQKGP